MSNFIDMLKDFIKKYEFSSDEEKENLFFKVEGNTLTYYKAYKIYMCIEVQETQILWLQKENERLEDYTRLLRDENLKLKMDKDKVKN